MPTTTEQGRYGHFNEDGTEFIVTDPRTPRAFDNFLWNDAIFSNVQQTGVGYADYQVGDHEAVQLLTGIGRVCDFDVFGRDGLMSRLVYIRDNDSGEYWNVNWEPTLRPYQSFACVHGMGYSIIRNTTADIAAEFRIFVPPGADPCELWTLQLRNAGGSRRNLSVFVYNQFQFKFKWGFESYGDMIFRGSWFNAALNAMVACKHPHRRPHDFLTGFVTADRPADGWDGTRDAFVGTYSTMQSPRAVAEGRCSNTPGSSDATIGALQFDLRLEAGGSERIDLILGATDAEARIADFRARYFAPGAIEASFAALAAENRRWVGLNRVRTPDAHFDRMLNVWTKQETRYGATWCRWGWNGYRDIVQHGYGVSSLEPTRTRRILLDAFRHQYRSGMALRGWNPVDTKPYSDSALWLVFTLVSYLKETGDTALLGVEVPFFDGGAGTVRQHIDAALDFLEANKGSHQLILIKFGDWNDSLTAVGKEGRGESIWLSEAYAEAMRQMEGLAAHLGEQERVADYAARYGRIKAAINSQAWDGSWYVRCYDDAGKPIGSQVNTQGRIYTNAQSWAMISGVADQGRTAQMLQSLDRICLTGIGYMLLAPTFFERDESVGRISCLEPGICENGTVYSHVNVWMVLGLLRAGMPDKAYETFRRITPGYFTGEADDPKLRVPPFVYANGYFGPDHRNNAFQMEFTWITGSVAWFYNVLLKDMLGAKADYDGLRIEPCLPTTWKEVSVRRSFRGTIWDITVRNPEGIVGGTVALTVDGRPLPGNLIPVSMNDGGTHQVLAVVHPA